MKRLISLVFLLTATSFAQTNVSIPGSNPCLDPTSSLSSVALNASGATAVQVIALASGKKVFICGITVVGGGTSPTFSIVFGTGTNCATGQTVLTTAVPLVATAAFNFVNPVASPTAKGVMSFVQQ